MISTLGYAQKRRYKAKSRSYSQGSNVLHLGIGLAPTYYGGGYLNSSIPLDASYEYGFTDRISGGAFLGYSTNNSNYYNLDYYYKFTYLLIGARASYHFFFIPDTHWDPYAGAS